MDNPFLQVNEEALQGNWIVDLLQSVVIALFIVIVVYLFIVIPNQVTGPSMEPNFHNGELVLTSKVNQWLGNTEIGGTLGLAYQRGDVIVFQKPGNLDLIKRIVGLPGESVMIADCEVYVNDVRVEETYIPSEVCTSAGSYATPGRKVTLAINEYFVLGDNRGNSRDSRYTEYGPINRDWIKGKVILRYLPLDVFGIIGSGEIIFDQQN
jgi:signal peptidase I